MPVRLLGRLTLVLILDALALLALSALLSGFTLAGPIDNVRTAGVTTNTINADDPLVVWSPETGRIV